AGAGVFLAAPRPYLGDDMTATLRLWLEEGEKPKSPLAKKIFEDGIQQHQLPDPNRIDCTYETDLLSAAQHADSNPPRLLTDGLWGNPVHQSVQYDGDVNIVVDLGKSQELDQLRLMAYQRETDGKKSGFLVKSVTVSTSDDKKDWKQAAVIEEEQNPQKTAEGRSVTFAAPLKATARYVKLSVQRPPDISRVLLGEIEITRPGSAKSESEPAPRPAPRPMHVKKTLDDALIEAGVPFLFGSYPTDVLRDAEGNPCGIVMANRAGRQAVIAKMIIDATERGLVARLAGAEFRPYPSATHTLKRVVIGGEPNNGPSIAAREISPPFRGPYPNEAKTSSGVFKIIEYTLELPMPDDGPASWAKADQQARSMTYDPQQQFTSDMLFEVPPDAMIGRQSADGVWQGMDAIPLGAFRPKGVARMYVLSGVADISRPQAEKLLRPCALVDAGTRLGIAAAGEAKSLRSPKGARLPGKPAAQPASQGDVREFLGGVRPNQDLPKIPQDARALPVLGRYDVVVIGGGTAGAPAGIAAARQGAKTLVVEYLSGLGGVGTTGAISKYYWGNRVGFTAEVFGGHSWVIEQRMHWYRDEILKAGGDIWFGAIGAGAFVDGNTIKGAVVATAQGRGVVLADVVIDATGNSDVAAAAGAACWYTDESEFAMQGTGLPPRQLGAAYANTDYSLSDETDMLDVWKMFVHAKDKFPTAFDLGQLIDTRERRRIVGDYTLNILDQVNNRTFPDTIVRAYSNFDTHGYTIDPYFMLEHPMKKGVYCNIPYRCFLPKGYEGLFVAGLGISAHRDAVPVIRMQPDIQNGGYAVGVAAAMASRADIALRQVDLKALQRHLVEIGNLPLSVLTDEDSFPPSPDEIKASVETVADENAPGAAVVLACPEQSLPLLREAYQKADAARKLGYAKILATMGDAAGLPTLISALEAASDWDEGWDFKAGGQFGHAMSPLDCLIVAMGRTHSPEAVPVILDKLALLSAETAFSHHRAAGLALELIGDPRAAKPLAELLRKPGMTGYAHVSLQRVRELDQGGNPNATRRDSLRELMLARALYRCGDYEGLGQEILAEYAKDLRGHLARHAQAVLAATQ
ncbi:MAG: FAD-dependent oxidoreductase, partial [Pirellulales bacterium]|nr:FAD-dependent oxidoreductase [Pirellulales bacterium]